MGKVIEEINAKKNFIIKITDPHEKTITYDSIEQLFKNELKCNMFDANINIVYNYYNHGEFSLNLKCLIRNYVSADFLLDGLKKCFPRYSIRKADNNKFIFLDADLLSATGYHKVRQFCEKIKNVEQSNENGFSFFIKNIEIDKNKMCLFLSDKTKSIIKKIISIEIDNFINFNFSYYDENTKSDKSYSATNYEVEEFFKS